MRLYPAVCSPAVFFLALVLGLAGSAATLGAQAGLDDEDLEFARGLTSRRMHDLAKDVLDRIVGSASCGEGEKACATLEIANLFKDKFARGLTFDERIEASEKADAAYRAFVTRYPDHPRIQLARFDYAEFLVYLGRYRIRLRDETLLVGGSAEKAEGHRAIALAKLKKAAELFEQLTVTIPGSGKEEELGEVLELGSYYRAILAYDLGRAEQDEAVRLATFEDGINSLADYIFDNEDNLRGFFGYLYKGLCHRELAGPGHKADAIACLEGVTVAFRHAIANPNQGWKTWADALADPSAKDLLERAYWRLAETYNRFGEHDAAIARVDEMKKIYAGAGAGLGNPGYRALLEQAQARYATGGVSAAIAGVSAVATAAGAGNRFIQFHCDRHLARYLEEVEDRTRLDADLVFKAARGAYTQDRWREAMRHSQTVLAIRKGAGPMTLDCWDCIGRCYERLGFPREDALATATAAFKLKAVGERKAFDMAQRARRTLQRIALATRSPADTARLDRHKMTMEQVFDISPAARFAPAFAAMAEGRFEQAIEAFAAIREDADRYELAQAYIVWCTFGQAEKDYRLKTAAKGVLGAERQAALDARAAGYECTIQLAERYFARAEATPIRGEPVKQKNREQARGVAVLARAAALKGLGRSAESLVALGYFDGAGAAVASRSQLLQARVLEVQLLLDRGELERAEGALAKLESGFPDAAKNVVNLKGILGAGLQKMAETLASRGRETEALAALVKSIDYRRAWVKAGNPKIENLFSLAKDLYTLNRFDAARTYLEEILTRAGGVEKPKRRLRTTLRLTRTYLARCLVRQGNYIEAQPILRRLHHERQRDKKLLKEYAALLTGTVITVDGKLAYVPGRGADHESAMKGYRLWERVARWSEGEVDAKSQSEYLEARFHQNLVRWAQNAPAMARKSIRQLRGALGLALGGMPGAHEPGHWEKRFAWLEKQLNRKPPQTPPPLPAPRG